MAIGWEVLSEEPQDGAASQPFARARAAWDRIHQSSEPSPLPESLLGQFPQNNGAGTRSFELPLDSRKFRKSNWDHKVMVSEVGPNGNVQPQAIYNWLQESVFDASAQAGWPTDRRLATGFITLQTQHDTEFISFPKIGDLIRISSRAIEVRRFRGTWFSESMRKLPNDELLIRDYSTGVYLDLTGRPATPPVEMMKDIHIG